MHHLRALFIQMPGMNMSNAVCLFCDVSQSDAVYGYQRVPTVRHLALKLSGLVVRGCDDRARVTVSADGGKLLTKHHPDSCQVIESTVVCSRVAVTCLFDELQTRQLRV